jgi:hypothetical protein
MLSQKLAEAKYVYEEELEYISKQFEDLQEDVIKLKNDKFELRRKIAHLEGIITQQ